MVSVMVLVIVIVVYDAVAQESTVSYGDPHIGSAEESQVGFA